MVQPLYYTVDPDDPQAPPQEMWDCMTPAEREHVCEMLPAEVPIDIVAPEGDLHREAKEDTLDALGTYFRKGGRRVYLSSELAVYYPGKRRIVPDVIAVVDVDPKPRDKWVVSKEGKGVDLALEVHLKGDKAKDHERNVERYAGYGIPEYFIFDRGNNTLKGYRLPSPNARVYQPILPQGGRFHSSVLEIDLCIEEERLRFYNAGTLLLESGEIIGKLEGMVGGLLEERERARRAEETLKVKIEEERLLKEKLDEERELSRKARELSRKAEEILKATLEEERARAERERARAQENERRVAELLAEVDRLKKRL